MYRYSAIISVQRKLATGKNMLIRAVTRQNILLEGYITETM